MSNEIIFSIVGARPHFVKAAPFMDAMKESKHRVFTVHSGQHYDHNMSDLFFSELNLPNPDVNLGIGSGSHAEQTAAVMTAVEKLLLDHRPASVVVYGDTNTTLGAALAAAKLYIPVVHIEAGVRCGNRRMPEEINRGIIDNISDFLCCPSALAVENLTYEGLGKRAHNVGDFMYDTFLKAQLAAQQVSLDLSVYGVVSGKFYLSTLHREETTASIDTLRGVLDSLGGLDHPVLLPMHPRTKSLLRRAGISLERADGLKIIDPVGYLEMVSLLHHSSLVITDSGGLQKEAYWSGVPCVTLMRETAWPETVDAGWNKLAGLDPVAIKAAVKSFFESTPKNNSVRPEIYGPPGAALRMVNSLGWL